MNGTAESVPNPIKLPSSPRPPAVGEEVKVFHDLSYRSSDHHKNMEDCQSTCEGDKPDLVIDEDTSESETLKYEDTLRTSNPSPPAPCKWAQSLQCLLNDVKGVDLFEQFLLQEGHDTRSLSFYFACRGVKKTNCTDKDKLHKLISVLYDRKLKRICAVSPQTKQEIRHKLATRTGVDLNIFDDAQKEVEQFMLNTTYPNFLSSDVYLNYLQSVEDGEIQEGEDHSTQEPSELPTVHEDIELSFSKAQNYKESLLTRRKLPSYKIKPDSQVASYAKSPYSSNYSSYHTKYASFLPVSAQDSELQSLSSDAQTDDTMSQTDSSIDIPMHCRPKQKRTSKTKYSGVLNKDTRLNLNNFIPRTQRPVPESVATMATKDPAKFHAVLVEKLQRIEEEQKTKEKFNEKYQAIEGSQPQPFHPLQLQPAEDNVQDILDAHVSRVFKDTGLTPTLSPICNSPPVMKLTGEDLQRVPPSGQNDHIQDMLNSYSQRVGQPPPFTVPYAMRYNRRDVDTRSSDSGALTDWTSEDNLQSLHRPIDYASSSEALEYSQLKRNRDHQLKRYISKKNQADSASSCVDSGISVACEPLPNQSSCHSKVSSWLESKKCASEMEKDHQWKNASSTSPVLSRSSSSRKAVAYNSTRSGVLDPGSTHWPLVPAQPVAQDLSMPALPVPDTTTNLLEARRRLEDESRTKPAKSKYNSGSRNSHEAAKLRNSFRASNPVDESNSHSRKQSKKSLPPTFMEGTSLPAGNSDVTIIGYSYGRDSVPYKSRFPGKNITLRQFKSLLSKKGNFKYWFKRVSDEFGTGVVLEEVSDDNEILPLWEGKVFCVIESVDENTANED
ncbi:axin-2-like isoform X2 [Argiope bruennichi]|uniref:axin-2-like isoform X2 n=1 Tax=Argiope bruennichi TaxID=94029 RepID=UPI002494A76F|nr:axin-2-like isoform X2 [Argiope bruennichi]